MSERRTRVAELAGRSARHCLGRLDILALFPIVILLADWAGFDNLALVTALGLSGLLAIAVIMPSRRDQARSNSAPDTGNAALLELLSQIADTDGRDTVCLLVKVMDWAQLADTWGHETAQDVSGRLHDRLRTALRAGDRLSKLGDARFGIVLAGLPAARMGMRDTLAQRLADVAQEPIPLHGAALRLSVAIGHASLRTRAADPATATFRAAEAALTEASASGKGEIRAYSDGMRRTRSVVATLSGDVEEALHTGAIDAWFHPHICAETGALTGLEAIARWQHPVHGLLGPVEIMPAITASGQERLFGETILRRATEALAEYDTTNEYVPGMTVTLSEADLQDPDLPDRIRFELIRYDLSSDRLSLEFPADLVARQSDETLTRNLAALQADGHRLIVDRADPASVPLLALHRFCIDQLKIDRAFVLGIDTDPQKTQAVGAIVAMASVMKMDTLATGVETPQEQGALAGLGCTHLQGYGIARPMRRDQVIDWVRTHRTSSHAVPQSNILAG